MIPVPPPNTRAHPYRGLSVQEVDVPLTEAALLDHLQGREVYRRTRYLALRNNDATALLEVRKASEDPLFSPVVEARLLAGPQQCTWIESPETDVGNANALAAAITAHRREGVRAYVVLGRYEHVNFLFDPQPVRIQVAEVVPPTPAKLFDQALRVLSYDEDLPPVELTLDAVHLLDLARRHDADEYLLPCRGSGVLLDRPVSYLDTRPAQRRPWTLVGCERSEQFHRQFYGDVPERLDICPRRRPTPENGELRLTKCCLLERGIEVDGNCVIVPWGANLDEVRRALHLLVRTDAAVSAGTPT